MDPTDPRQDVHQLVKQFSSITLTGEGRAAVLEYLNAYRQSRNYHDLVRLTRASKFNVSVAAGEVDLANITRRAVLVASNLVITHDRSAPRHETATETGWEPSRHFVNTDYIHCQDIDELGRWLHDAAPLRQSGQVIYIPNTEHDTYYEAERISSPYPDPVVDLMLSGGRLTQLRANATLGSRLMRPLMRLDLPTVEGVRLRDFAEIVTGETQAYVAFRDHLRRMLIPLDGIDDPDEIERQIGLIEVDLSQGTRELSASLKVIARKNAVQVAGAALAVGSATLVAVAAADLVNVVAALGLSGGALGLFAALTDAWRGRSEEHARPYYFLWLMERESRRA